MGFLSVFSERVERYSEAAIETEAEMPVISPERAIRRVF